jgi:hypothetical protein
MAPRAPSRPGQSPVHRGDDDDRRGTWAFSALKFQADMGVLLAFMFFLNMLGALFLLPALAAFLLKPHAAKPA